MSKQYTLEEWARLSEQEVDHIMELESMDNDGGIDNTTLEQEKEYLINVFDIDINEEG